MTTHSNTRPSTALALRLAAAVLTLTSVGTSHAQQPAGNARTFISINGGLQALTGSFTESVVFPESGGVYREVLSAAAAQEQARLESDYRYRTGPLFDVSGGVRGVPYFALGAGISWFSTEETAAVSAQLPHPLFFNRTRSISGVSSPPTALALRLAAAVLTLTSVGTSHAQQPAGNARTFISINGGLQALTGSFTESVVFPESGGVYREVLSAAAAQEQARLESDYRYRTGPLFDVSGGVRVAPYFALGAGISWFSTEETAAVSAQLPHPLFFNRTRSISGVSSPLTRSEMAVHLQAYVVVPATNSLTVMGFAGPTFFNVKQQLVTDVNFTHAYPFNTATFSSAVASRESGSTIGFNVGADVAWYFTDHVGIGWFTRYSRATLELPSAGNGTLEIKPGGLHTAGGLRLRF